MRFVDNDLLVVHTVRPENGKVFVLYFVCVCICACTCMYVPTAKPSTSLHRIAPNQINNNLSLTREMSSCLYTSGNAYYEDNGTLVYTLERTPRGGCDTFCVCWLLCMLVAVYCDSVRLGVRTTLTLLWRLDLAVC